MGNSHSDEDGASSLRSILRISSNFSTPPVSLPPFETVLSKIREHEQYAELHRNEEYMSRFAQCLSDPQTMRQTYLSLDWAISREWVTNYLQLFNLQDGKLKSIEQQRLAKTKVFNISSTSEQDTDVEKVVSPHARNLSNPILSLTASKSETVKISDINPATDSIIDDEEEEDEELTKQEWLMMNPVLENRVPVKLVITDMHLNNKGKRTIRSIVSPVLSNFTFMPEFGMFHTALCIGQWKIEWTDSALCVPRKICARASLLTADVDADIATLTDLTTTVDKLAMVITKWNTTYSYTERSYAGTGQLKGNCQDFVMDVLSNLGLELKVSGALDYFLKQMRRKGKCQAEFKMTEEFQSHFGVKEKKIKFETHEQLDKFVTSLGEEFYCATRDPKWKDEYILLKSFDRGLWLRHIRKEDDNSAAGKQCRPLLIEQRVPDLSQGITGEKIQMVHACPFEDPRDSGSVLVQK